MAGSTPFRQLAGVPSHMKLILGEDTGIHVGVPYFAIRADRLGAVALDGKLVEGWTRSTSNQLRLTALQEEPFQLDLRFMGIIPIRSVTVSVLPQKKLLPGGQSIGIDVESQGVMIVRDAPVWNGRTEVYPAREADLREGDLIITINGQLVQNKEQASQLLSEASANGSSVTLGIRRGSRAMTKEINPVFDVRHKRNLLGVWVRDSAAGVGTLTFVDPETNKYGALGHMITDNDTARPYPLREGKILEASISGIRPGRQGIPGEKIGVFLNMQRPLGDITVNSAFGVFGTLDRHPPHALFNEPLPIALQSQIRTGPAQIITVINDQKPELFDIEIERVVQQPAHDGRSMIVRVTDPVLLEKTGGIVQGMSGSPIIQEGRIVGAVTHVFVHDPTRGYGVSIELMLQQIDNLNSNFQSMSKEQREKAS